MTVYLVEEIYYDESIVHGVFSSYEKALKYVTTAKPKYWPTNTLDADCIEEYEVDMPVL